MKCGTVTRSRVTLSTSFFDLLLLVERNTTILLSKEQYFRHIRPYSMTLLARFQREVNRLVDQDRGTRKRGLLKLLEDLPWETELQEDREQLTNFLKAVIPTVSVLVSDPIEKCRELSLRFLLKTCAIIDPLHMLNTVSQPLCGRVNDVPFLEPAEEIRLLILTVFSGIIAKLTVSDIPAERLQVLLHMLGVVISDSFPSVKVEATNILVQLLPDCHASISMNYKTLIKNLLQNVFHQHAKVRSITLRVRFYSD